jgi:hypothetical protein
MHKKTTFILPLELQRQIWSDKAGGVEVCGWWCMCGGGGSNDETKKNQRKTTWRGEVYSKQKKAVRGCEGKHNKHERRKTSIPKLS